MLKDKTLLAYTAGIIDGEGSISIARQSREKHIAGYSHRVQVCVTSTNEWLCQWLRLNWGGNVYKGTTKTKPHYKQAWKWTIVTNKSINFLEAILPYLNLKRDEAELAIQWQQIKRKRGSRHITSNELMWDDSQSLLMKELKRQ